MAFVSTLNDDWTTTATFLNLEVGEGEFVITLPIGFDDESNAVLSVLVCLATVPGYGKQRYELVFHIVIAEDDEEDFRSDGLETITVLTCKYDRAQVLSAILYATKRLIEEVTPLAVIMVTHELNLPEKALVKYEKIAAVFREAGYKAGRGDPMYGQQIWMMTKQ